MRLTWRVRSFNFKNFSLLIYSLTFDQLPVFTKFFENYIFFLFLAFQKNSERGRGRGGKAEFVKNWQYFRKMPIKGFKNGENGVWSVLFFFRHIISIPRPFFLNFIRLKYKFLLLSKGKKRQLIFFWFLFFYFLFLTVFPRVLWKFNCLRSDAFKEKKLFEETFCSSSSVLHHLLNVSTFSGRIFITKEKIKRKKCSKVFDLIW